MMQTGVQEFYVLGCSGMFWMFYLHSVVCFSPMAPDVPLDLRIATQREDKGRSEQDPHCKSGMASQGQKTCSHHFK